VRLPLHHYDQPLAGVVVAGNVAHPVPGNPDSQQTLGPGSLFSFAANEPHETNNVGDGFALFFIFQEHPWVLAMDV
jgi:quercetin dioxygenase-like cupin family protein